MEITGLTFLLNIVGAVVVIFVGLTSTVLNVIKIRNELRQRDEKSNG